MHTSLFRYKCLNFALRSASEVLQYMVQSVIAGVKGTKNISDDITIHSAADKEHNVMHDHFLDSIQALSLSLLSWVISAACLSVPGTQKWLTLKTILDFTETMDSSKR